MTYIMSCCNVQQIDVNVTDTNCVVAILDAVNAVAFCQFHVIVYNTA